MEKPKQLSQEKKSLNGKFHDQTNTTNSAHNLIFGRQNMSNLQKAQDFFKAAEKKEKSWGFFSGGAKWEEAADLYVKAANLFKMEKKGTKLSIPSHSLF